MPDDMTPLQKRTTEMGIKALGIESPDLSGPEHLTPMERALYNDCYTTSTTVYDEKCYICRDPDFARMGLPLCRECDECKANGRGLGHVPADDVECTICCAKHYGWTPEGAPVAPRIYTDEDRAREQRMMDIGLRYKVERDEAREQLRAMTAARDHCKRQATEAGERLVAANAELARLGGPHA